MKPDDIRRSVRTSHRERAAGDAPSMGKMARMPGTGLPKEKKRRRKSRTAVRKNRARRSRKRVIATWSAVVCAVTVAGLGLAIWLGMHFKPGKSSEQLGKATLAKNAAEVIPEKVRAPSLPEGAALALVKKGLAVRDVAEISEYFRQGEVGPQAQVEFLAGMAAKEGEIERYEWLGSMDANGLAIDCVLVEFKSPDRHRNRLASLVPDKKGRWKIDFDAFARTAIPAWEEFLAKRAQTAKVRVYVAKDSYYNGPFKNESEWLSVGLASPDIEEILTAYCRVGSPQAAAMQWIFAKESPPSRAVLELKRVEGAESRQFEISRVLAEEWITADVAFDEGFK